MPINNNEKLLQTIKAYSKEQEKARKEDNSPKRDKTDKFLQAIQRYAKLQKNVIKVEAKQKKTERLKEAEKQARAESDKLVKDTLRSERNRQTAVLAKKTQEGQKELFLERSRMVDDIFKAAEEKLIAYTQTDGYKKKLKESAESISELFEGKSCVLYVNERDLSIAEGFAPMFKGGAEVLADRTVRIGGLRGYCEELGIIADETLDSRLEDQREWFIENSSLAVL